MKVVGMCFLLVLGIFSSANAQYFGENRFGILTGYVYQSEHFVQIGGFYGKFPTNARLPNYSAGIASELHFSQNSFLSGVKIFGGYNYSFLGARANLGAYFYEGKTDIRFIPEFGFSFLGRLTVFYGYALSLTETEISQVGKDRLNVSIHILL